MVCRIGGAESKDPGNQFIFFYAGVLKENYDIIHLILFLKSKVYVSQVICMIPCNRYM